MSNIPENSERPVPPEQPGYTTNTKVVNHDNYVGHHHHHHRDKWKWIYAGGATIVTLLIFLVGFAMGLATGVHIHGDYPERSYVHPLPAPYQPYLYDQNGGMVPGNGYQYHQGRGSGNSSGLSNGQTGSSSGEMGVPSTGSPTPNQ